MNKNIIKDVSKILEELDPLDLIAQGAPNDEYDNEAIHIAGYLIKSPSSGELKKIILDLFLKEFEESLDEEKLEILVEKLKNISVHH